MSMACEAAARQRHIRWILGHGGATTNGDLHKWRAGIATCVDIEHAELDEPPLSPI